VTKTTLRVVLWCGALAAIIACESTPHSGTTLGRPDAGEEAPTECHLLDAGELCLGEPRRVDLGVAVSTVFYSADVDGDEASELVTQDGHIIRDVFGSLTVSRIKSSDGLTIRAFGDLDGDGDTDLVGLVHPTTVAVLRNDGLGNFTPWASFVGAEEDWNPLFDPIAVADFNGDGRADIAVLRGESDGVGVHLSQSDDSFVLEQLIEAPPYLTFFVAPADLNGDGAMDLALGAATDVYAEMGDGTGWFTHGPTSFAGHFLHQTPMPALAAFGVDAVAMTLAGGFLGDLQGTLYVARLVDDIFVADALDPGTNAKAPAVGRLDGTGLVQVAMLHKTGNVQMLMLCEDETGAFQPCATVELDQDVRWMAMVEGGDDGPSGVVFTSSTDPSSLWVMEYAPS